MIIRSRTCELRLDPSPSVQELADEYGICVEDVTPCHLKLVDDDGVEWELLRPERKVTR